MDNNLCRSQTAETGQCDCGASLTLLTLRSFLAALFGPCFLYIKAVPHFYITEIQLALSYWAVGPLQRKYWKTPNGQSPDCQYFPLWVWDQRLSKVWMISQQLISAFHGVCVKIEEIDEAGGGGVDGPSASANRELQISWSEAWLLTFSNNGKINRMFKSPDTIRDTKLIGSSAKILSFIRDGRAKVSGMDLRLTRSPTASCLASKKNKLRVDQKSLLLAFRKGFYQLFNLR